MEKFINVTVDGKVLSLNVNHIIALQQDGKVCCIYLSAPVGLRHATESREEILTRIKE